jgi:hypothetical protein
MTDVQLGTPQPPATPAAAATRLTQLKADPAWTKAWLSGSGPQAKEYNDLSELAAKGDKVDLAMAGVMEDGPFQDSGHLQNIAMATMLREIGFNELQVRETLSGRPASQAEVDMANQWKAQNLKSKEFLTRLMAGEPTAVRELWVANIILTSPLKKADAA